MNSLYLLTESDVRPELLTADERKRLNTEYDRVMKHNYDVERSREINPVHDERERLLNDYARRVGFRDYDELKDVRWSARRDTPENIVAMRNFYALQNSPEYLDVNERIQAVHQKYEARMDMHRQRHYYRILQVTRPRMDTTDVHNNPVKSADEWMTGRTVAQSDGLHTDSLSAAHPALHLGADGISASAGSVTSTLQGAGFTVDRFHTGLVCDHPDDRYVRDDASLGVRAGEHRAWGSQPHAFSLVIRDDGFDRNVLSDIATSSGMYLEVHDTDGGRSVEFTLPATVDGCSISAVLAEHYRLSDGRDILDAALLKRIADAHDGWAVYSDDMVRARASMLCNRLINRVEELKAANSVAEQLDRIDISRLFDSYISLVAQVYGDEKAALTRQAVLDGSVDWDAPLEGQADDVSRSGFYVFLDSRTSQVTVIDRSKAKYPPAMLEQAHIKEVGDRISHVCIYPGLDGSTPHWLRCRIDGGGQQSVQLTLQQDRLWRDACHGGHKDAVRLRLATECFAGLLSQPAARHCSRDGSLGR